MSRLSNLTTIKIGIFKSWNGYWFDKMHYSSLLFNDLKIRDYLTGIFYRLKIISDYIYLYRLLNNIICIKTNLVFFSNLKFKTITLKKVYVLNEQYIFFYRKKTWLQFIESLSYFLSLSDNLIYINSSNNCTDILQCTNILSLYYSTLYVSIKYLLSYNKTLFTVMFSMFKIMFNLTITSFINNNTVILYKDNFFNYSYYYLHNIYMLNTSFINPTNITFNWIYLDWYKIAYLKSIYYCYIQFIKYLFLFNVYISNINLNSILANLHIISISSFDSFNIYNLIIDQCMFTLYFINRRFITQSLFMLFRTQIEGSIMKYEQQNIYLNFAISFKKNPFILSAKLITESLVYLLQAGKKIVQSFFFIRNWQSALYMSRRKLEYLYYQYSLKRMINLNYLFFYATKRTPVIGIRIECSGTFKKGRMSRIYFYSSWIKNDLLTGKMPNNTIIADIDYYQYMAVTKSSSLGIKTWIFLETHIYNNNHKYISIVY
jgi:hypothetical protein